MSASDSTVIFVAREFVRGAAETIGGTIGGAVANRISDFLCQRFTDHSQALFGALQTANDRAWRALEVALAGDSWWQRVKSQLGPAEDRAFATQIQAYLTSASFEGLTLDRAKCLEQLRGARQRKELGIGAMTAQDFAQQAGRFANFRDPEAIVQEENRALLGLADRLRRDYPHLAALLTVQARKGETLLAIGMRYFFRRAVEENPELARGLSFARMEKLQQTQEAGFAALHQLIVQRDGKLFTLLGDVHASVLQTQEAVLDIQAEQRRQGEQNRLLYDTVIAILKSVDLMRSEVRPQDSQSIRNDSERREIQRVTAQFRALPEAERRQLPALLNGIGKLEVAAGDFRQAENTFRSVAHAVKAPEAQAEARFNAYRAALENRDWDTALRQILEAAKLDPNRFTPFPMGKYQPLAILGAGGFGVAFLCNHKELMDKVVVKTLASTELDRDADMVLDEARILWKLEHSSIIRLIDCGYVLPKAKARPYLVMRHFDGLTLEQQVKDQTLPVDDVLVIARQIADGLRTAHENNVLHRDIKPANVLVHEAGDDWQVKLIDFGLAVRSNAIQGTEAASKTLVGSSIAGTLEYAAPEQMAKLPGVAVGRYSDVYSFAKTCCYALFRTPNPLLSQWKKIPPSLARLLEDCLAENPQQRPPDFEVVSQRLAKVRRSRRKAEPEVTIESPAPGASAPPPADTRSHQLPSAIVAKEFGEVNVARRSHDVVVQLVLKPTMEGAKKQGWQTGVAIDGSASMRTSFGCHMKGKVPPEIMAEYESRGWLSERVADGRTVKTMKLAAHEDAVRRGLLRPGENIIQPLARNFIALLADRLDADGGTTVTYWACGDGREIEVVGDFTAKECRTLNLSGPKHFGIGTHLLPAMRYFVDRFADAPKGIYVFLVDGNLDDLAEVKKYTKQLAQAIAAGKRNFVKCVLVGVGDQIDPGPMEELDDLDTGTDVDIWDHKLVREMRDITDIFAELADETQIVAPRAKIYDSTGAVVKKFSKGLPGKVEFTLPAGSPWFELELPDKRIRQPLGS